MQLTQLQQLMAVYRTMNITKAAEQLHMTQPALSRSIRQLEEELTFPCFEREGNRITAATAAGEIFIEGTARALDTLAQAEQASREAMDRHQLRRFCIVTTVGDLGAVPVETFISGDPAAAVFSYDAAGPFDLQGLFQDKRLNVAITTQVGGFPGMAWQQLYTEHYLLAAAPGTPPPTVQTLGQCRLLCVGADLEDKSAEQLLRCCGVRAQVAFRCVDAALLLRQTLAGQGVTILPVSRAEAWRQAGAALFPPPEDGGCYAEHIGVMYNPLNGSEPLTMRFLALCRAYFGALEEQTRPFWSPET